MSGMAGQKKMRTMEKIDILAKMERYQYIRAIITNNMIKNSVLIRQVKFLQSPKKPRNIK